MAMRWCDMSVASRSVRVLLFLLLFLSGCRRLLFRLHGIRLFFLQVPIIFLGRGLGLLLLLLVIFVLSMTMLLLVLVLLLLFVTFLVLLLALSILRLWLLFLVLNRLLDFTLWCSVANLSELIRVLRVR